MARGDRTAAGTIPVGVGRARNAAAGAPAPRRPVPSGEAPGAAGNAECGRKRQNAGGAMSSGSKLSRKQEAVISALLTQRSIRRAADAAGVSDRALRTWLADPGFAAAYRAARRQLVQHAVCQVQRATGRAVRTLVRLL